MAKFSSFNTGLMKETDALNGIVLEKPELDLSDVTVAPPKVEFDFMGQLSQMSQTLKPKDEGTESGLALDEGLGPDMFEGLVADKFVDADQTLLEKANQYIRQKKFEQAIQVLDQLLKGSPNNHEAAYLKALCLASKRKKENEAALKLLKTLLRARLYGSLVTKVRILRDRVKKALFIQVMFEHLILLKAKKQEVVIQRLRQILELIPEEPIYYFMLGGALMMEDRFTEALRVVDKAIVSLPGGLSTQLRGLRSEIIKRHAVKALRPALVEFKRGQHAKAQSLLKSLGKPIRNNPVCIIFENYLKDIRGGFLSRMFGGKPSAQKATPRGGTKQQIDSFYHFLCGDELGLATKYLLKGEFADSERILRPVVGNMLPLFPFANYLCAVSIYFRLQHSFAAQKAPKLEQAIADMKMAHAMAKIGQKDSSVGDAANLSAAIGRSLQMLLDVGKVKERMDKEVKPVNEAVKEFNTIMESAKGGISSTSQYNRVFSRMEALVKKVERLRKSVKNPQGAKILRDLHTAALRNFNQLQSMKNDMKLAAEAEMVKGHWDGFNTVAKVLNNPGSIKSQSDLERLLDMLQTMRENAVRDKRNVSSSQGREAMDKLIDQLDRILGMAGR